MRQGLLPGIKELISDAKKNEDSKALGLLIDKLIETIETMDKIIFAHEKTAELAGFPLEWPNGKPVDHLIGKTVKTRGGFEVEIIAVRPELYQPIVGILNTEGFVNGPYELHQWHDDGTFFEYENAHLDLVLE